MADQTNTVVVTDANVLINLVHIGRLDLLALLSGLDFVIPEEVTAEIKDPDQRAVHRLALACQPGGQISGGAQGLASGSGGGSVSTVVRLPSPCSSRVWTRCSARVRACWQRRVR